MIINLKEKTNRNHYIDALRGIAALMVILIHTAFHSGFAYVPMEVRSLTLLFEVPIFFFLSGWSFSYVKSNKKYVKGIVHIQLKYMVYITLVFLAIFICNRFGFSNNPINQTTLVEYYFHIHSIDTAPFLSISASLWFFKVYFFISLIAMGLLSITKQKLQAYLCIGCALATFIISFFFPSANTIDFGITLDYLFFYLFFFLLGYLLKEKHLSWKGLLVCFISTAIGLVSISFITGANILDIQTYKFPAHFIYLLWSMFGIYLVLFFKKHFISMKENILTKIGQNAIYFYLAQGIGASILYVITKYITFEWYFKLPIMFLINIAITCIFVFILKLLLEPFEKWINRVCFKEKP